MQQTYIMLKPDAVRRGLIGEILSRIEKKGFIIKQIKMMSLTSDILEVHYAHIVDKPFYPGVLAGMTSGPVVAMIVEGPDVIAGMRRLMGATKVEDAIPGTIRGDFATTSSENLIHGSDSEETAAIEIERFFGKLV